MSVSFTRERIRLVVDAVSMDGPLDHITGQTPSFWRGTDLALEVGIFYGDALVDVSGYSSVTAEVRDSETRTSVVLATRTLAGVDLNATLTADEWEAGGTQHALFAWTSDETNWDLHGQKQRTFWLVIHAITTDSPPRRVTLGAGEITVMEDGAGVASNSPSPGDPTFPTLQQVQGMIGQVIRPGTNPAGATITLVSPNGQWARILGVNDDGSALDAIAAL